MNYELPPTDATRVIDCFVWRCTIGTRLWHWQLVHAGPKFHGELDTASTKARAIREIRA